MKHCWVSKKGTEDVVAVFLGWGADAKSLSRMAEVPCDVVAFYDYVDLQTEAVLDSYARVHVVAWSMGVYNAECYLREHRRLNVGHKTAIAGTCMPIDQQCGLIPEVCQGTLDNWAEATRRKFSMRMCGGRQGFVDLLPLMSDRDVESQKRELAAIMERDSNVKCQDAQWDKAYVSTEDLIFLPENQRRYWQGRAKVIEEIEMPHFPFGVLKDWNQLIG